MSTFTRLWRTDPVLVGTGLFLAALIVPFGLGLLLDPRIITGAPAWLKPLKFAVSTAIYAFTLAWVFTFLPDWPRIRRAVGIGTAAAFVLEVAMIGGQAWRGTTSHFNVATPLDAVIFASMGLIITAQTVLAAVLLTAVWRQRFADPALGWALRLGLLLTVLGASTGGLMTRATAAQIADARATHQMPVSGAHTVGAPDGGPGLPLTGWSTRYGDVRVPHFIGLHAWQVLPLFVLFVLPRRGNDRARTTLTFAAAGAYAVVFVGLLVQALSGRPTLPLWTPNSQRPTPKPSVLEGWELGVGSWELSMTPDQIFAIVNPLAALSWLALIVVPRRAAPLTGVAVPAIFAAIYAALIAANWSGADGGFSSLPDVARLFANRWLLLAGWVHYLCFDLLIGTWEVQDARTRGIPHLLVVPCLVLTFLFGPAGWLLYKGLAAAHSRSKG